MKIIRTYLLVIALFAAPVSSEEIAFVNINVLPMTSENILREQTVIVADGRIRSIGRVDNTPLPDEIEVVDGTDRYLMPGLSEMHGHVPGGSSENLHRVLSLYVVNGVTTVRGMLGQRSHLQLRKEISRRDILGPRLVTSGPSFNGRSVVSTAAATGMAEAQHAAGYDFLKIHPGLTLEEFDAMAVMANRLGMQFAGHVPEDVGLEHALASGMATIDHLDGYMQTLMPVDKDLTGGVSGFFGLFIADLAEEDKIDSIVAATAESGVWNVPTESLFEHVASPALHPEIMVDWPEMKYMPAPTVEQWRQAKREVMDDTNYSVDTAVRAIELRQKLILALHEAGAGLLLGSDSPQIFNVPGFAIHRELEYLVDAGLTPYEALRTGTVNAAQFLGTEHESGTVEVGRVADLVVLDANPLEDITNSRRVHGVVVDGQWISRQRIDLILSEFER